MWPGTRTLAITQNITVDGAIEMLTNWFDPQGQGDLDMSDLQEENHRQSSQAGDRDRRIRSGGSRQPGFHATNG